MTDKEITTAIGEAVTSLKKEFSEIFEGGIKEMTADFKKEIKDAKLESFEDMTAAIEKATKGLKGSGANIDELIDKRFDQFKKENGFDTKVQPKPQRNPGYKPEYPEFIEGMSGKVKIKVPNKIVLERTEANTFHEEGVDMFIAGGPTATLLIRKGMAKFVEVFDPKKKYDFKHEHETGEEEVEEEETTVSKKK